MKEAARFVETLVRTYNATKGCHNPWHINMSFITMKPCLTSVVIIPYCILLLLLLYYY